jgi:hypothetical protein
MCTTGKAIVSEIQKFLPVTQAVIPGAKRYALQTAA